VCMVSGLVIRFVGTMMHASYGGGVFVVGAWGGVARA
jgi:hypothetical protein